MFSLLSQHFRTIVLKLLAITVLKLEFVNFASPEDQLLNVQLVVERKTLCKQKTFTQLFIELLFRSIAKFSIEKWRSIAKCRRCC